MSCIEITTSEMLNGVNFYHMPSVNSSKISSTARGKHRKLAIITGATSGIGHAYARYFALKGYDLLITGRRSDVILKVATEIMNIWGINVDVVIADLSKDEDLSRLIRIIGEQTNIEVLVNNAGYALNGRFSEDDLDDQLAMLKVHVNAPLMIIHRVLPGMIENKNGIIINVSSLAMCLPYSSNAMYASTKSFLKSFTESLHLDVSHYGIHVQCICPGFTYSDFHRNFEFNKKKKVPGNWMSPTEVVDYSIKCLHKGQVVCIPGFLNRTLNLLAKTIPRSLYYLLAVRIEKRLTKLSYN